MLNRFYIEDHVKNALKEDVSFEDITTDNLTGVNDTLSCVLNTREDGVFCGKDAFETVFRVVSDDLKIKFFVEDGDEIKNGDKLAEISGPARAILTGERTALNYIQRMSAIATKSREFQNAIKEYGVRMVDTRKNTPNFFSTPQEAPNKAKGNDTSNERPNHALKAKSVFSPPPWTHV